MGAKRVSVHVKTAIASRQISFSTHFLTVITSSMNTVGQMACCPFSPDVSRKDSRPAPGILRSAGLLTSIDVGRRARRFFDRRLIMVIVIDMLPAVSGVLLSVENVYVKQLHRANRRESPKYTKTY